MSKMFMEIKKEDIENVDKTLKSGFCDYRVKDVDFTADSFENELDITLLQTVADEEYELVFETKFENGTYYISRSFEIIRDDLLEGRESRDVFSSVNKYFHDVIADESSDFSDEKESLINFLLLTEQDYDEDQLKRDLDPNKIREDYKNDYDRIYSDENMNRVEKSLALKELLHMSICQVVNDIDLFFTLPFDLTPEEEAEKKRQDKIALENELKLS